MDKPRVKWTENQTKQVLDLYLRDGGDLLDDHDAEVLKLAAAHKRSAGSIAFKLKNFRYLDSSAENEGKHGLRGFSRNDVFLWLKHTNLPLSNRAKSQIKEKGWEFDQTKRGMKRTRITHSLLAKPFLILTGPSGTGKTRGAIRLAEQLCSTGAGALVAIGADWTDNRHVLGYLNPLDKDEESGLPIYETTTILDLVRHANDYPEEPHVLILDEMNLSHVERYFADFLSAMELPDKENALKLHSAGEAAARNGDIIPGKIDFPENLFVIGTVNIDETTYMFSPKVLDRANVIEIHADETAIGKLLRGTSSNSAADPSHDYGIPFLDAARAIREQEPNSHVPELPSTVRDAASDELMKFFNILKKARCEFGYRSSREIIAYLRAAHFLAGHTENGRGAWLEGGWRSSLDEQVLQKILPKLHGSRSRLGPLLGALATLAATGEEALAMKHFPGAGNPGERSPRDAQGLSETKLPKSYEKLDQMIGILLEEQFVSFIS